MDDHFGMNQDNILVGSSSRNSRHKMHLGNHHSPKPLNVKTEYDDDCPLAPILVEEETSPMTLPPQFALQVLFQTLANMTHGTSVPTDTLDNEVKDAIKTDANASSKRSSSTISQLQSALSTLQGNERRFLLPLMLQDCYSLERLARLGVDALQGQDLFKLRALQEAAGPRWRTAIVRVKRIVSTDSDDDDDGDEQLDGSNGSLDILGGANDVNFGDDDDDDFADSRLYIDKLVYWSGKRPVDVRWFNLGLHSVQDGGIVLETEEKVEVGGMWSEVVPSTAAATGGELIYETYMLAFYDKAIAKNKFTWLNYY